MCSPHTGAASGTPESSSETTRLTSLLHPHSSKPEPEQRTVVSVQDVLTVEAFKGVFCYHFCAHFLRVKKQAEPHLLILSRNITENRFQMEFFNKY